MVRAFPQQNPFAFFSAVSMHGRNLGLAAISTLALLFIMSRLIATDATPPPVDAPAPIASVVMPEVKVVPIKDELPKPPQTLPPQMIVETHVSDPRNPTITTTVAPPPPTDGDFEVWMTRAPVPVYKPQPRYPRRALVRGIEGYVVVEFTITSSGAVTDVRAVAGYDASGEPTDVFNRSAVAAAERFKYQPQMEEGVAVERHGVRNRITYKIAE